AITYFDAPRSVFLAAEDDRQNRLEFGFDGASGFYMEVAAAGGPPARETAPYAQAERWWRIRAEAGSILFEASQDGAIWDLKRKVDTPFPITAMHARFGVRTTGAMSTPNVGIGVPSYNGL
ncbi:MAG: hypothetical protein IT372_09850, partial [Polyangiaceae bacterium]|nr:hypothetical protein [Polyangiaceae bacterium]